MNYSRANIIILTTLVKKENKRLTKKWPKETKLKSKGTPIEILLFFKDMESIRTV
jgi:hypothetical protein